MYVKEREREREREKEIEREKEREREREEREKEREREERKRFQEHFALLRAKQDELVSAVAVRGVGGRPVQAEFSEPLRIRMGQMSQEVPVRMATLKVRRFSMFNLTSSAK